MRPATPPTTRVLGSHAPHTPTSALQQDPTLPAIAAPMLHTALPEHLNADLRVHLYYSRNKMAPPMPPNPDMPAVPPLCQSWNLTSAAWLIGFAPDSSASRSGNGKMTLHLPTPKERSGVKRCRAGDSSLELCVWNTWVVLPSRASTGFGSASLQAPVSPTDPWCLPAWWLCDQQGAQRESILDDVQTK